MRALMTIDVLGLINKNSIQFKKVYAMGSEMQPQIMRAQKSEQIFIFEINKDY
jgi:hypothetical protein